MLSLIPLMMKCIYLIQSISGGESAKDPHLSVPEVKLKAKQPFAARGTTE